MTAWKLPLVVSAIALPIVAGFYVGGPGLGMAVGALAAATIIVLAVRKPPLEQIAIAVAPDGRPRLLVVLDAALEVSSAVAVAALAQDAAAEGPLPEVFLIAPCRSKFAERWTSDLGPGRRRARQHLDQGAALLAGLGLAASTLIGEEDTVQMTEDVLCGFAATELVLVDEGDGVGRALAPRLPIPLHRLQPAAERAMDPLALRRPHLLHQGRPYGAQL
ncbi:MAG TPA: hypothetical protein VJQ84_03090 [Solirubrobacterales bacterium]|nr:hypothetical protein [Solirubrobacterales bacterium]